MPFWAANLNGAVFVVLSILAFFSFVASVIMSLLGKAFGGNTGSDAVATRVAYAICIASIFSLIYLLYHPTVLYDMLRAFPRPPAVEITR
ncbi:hypothetical protein HOU00_gp408 [Caulobacter phage CcrPW]|uniref:Uncharacterized protein n=1 Tax=Caulobacter phage CcrPW TaxID=2283271 RepID=A0A385ED22_9CAUD|nr:hypothetical protein HOU00_gp408 [Caulobacter phage CcrPW]AXQ68717.1 hypothetical protein CcrPW_gp178c [Caulobacter phage CcrPW]